MANNLLLLINLVATILAAASLVSSEPKQGAQNVCPTPTTIRKEIAVEEPIKYNLKYQAMCNILPCTKTRVVERMESKLKTVFEEVEVLACCPGYSETPDQQCAPICLKSCRNGHCAKPGVCKCSPEPSEFAPGFIGATCNRFTCLSVNRWGSNCDRECNCPPNSYCSANTGKCLCRDGWRGANCTEECDKASMNCDELELPPILEPEANIIADSMLAQSQKLEALSPREFETVDDLDGASRTVTSLVATHMGINLFLTLLTFTLIFAVFWYKKRYSHLKSELYGSVGSTTYSSSTGRGGAGGSDYFEGGSSVYSATTATNGTNPRPTPNTDAQYLSKNLNFASATRNILMPTGDQEKQSMRQPQEGLNKFVVAPRVESHLASSKEKSEDNIYTDIESNFSGKSYQLIPNVIPEEKMLNISTNSSVEEEHQYQVPRSPAYRAAISAAASEQTNAFSYENNDGGEQIYEEIKPRLPPRGHQ